MAKIILNVTTDIKQANENVSKLKKSVEALGKAFSNVKADKEVTAQIKALTEWNKSLASAVEKVTKVNNQNALADEKLAQARAKTAQQTAKQQQEEQKLEQQTIKTADATGKLHITEEKLEQQQNKTAKSALDLENAQKKYSDSTENADKKTKGLVETLMQWSVTAKLVRSGINLIKSAVADMNETLAETEHRIIAIQRVLPDGSVGDQDLANRLYDLAIEYGQSFQNVSDIATDFARTGLSYADTIEATRAALLALNVAELDSTQATEGMIAIMAQFSLSADQMNDVVDKLNKTADRFPVTTSKLLTALQRMGSSASIAGLSLDESIGIATALSKATGRSGANVGTAANALIQYSTKTKALDTYAALSPEVAAIVEQYKIGAANVLDIWKALSKEINNLTYEQSEKLDVLAEYFETGDGKDLKGELEAELGDIFNDISGVFSTANTFRKNYFIALLQNMETVEEAAQTARDSQGYSIKENEKEMQTYEKRVTALQEHWHKLANDEQGWLAFRKGLVEIGDHLLTLLEWTGGLRTAFVALGTVIGLAFGQKVITMISGVITSIRSLTTATEGAAVAATTLSTAWQGVFAIVGIAITVISSLVGAIQQYQTEQHQARIETIEAWTQEEEQALKLRELYKRYKEVSSQTAEHKKIEEELVSILDDKSSALQGLTKDTDDYRKAIENLTEAELNEALRKSAASARAAKEEASKARYFDYSYLSEYGDVQRDLMLLGYTSDTDPNNASRALTELFGKNGRSATQYNIDSYKTATEAIQSLYKSAREDLRSGKINTSQYEERISSMFLKRLEEYAADLKPVIDSYLENSVSEYLQTFLYVNDLSGIHDEKTLNDAKQFVERNFYAQNDVTPSNYITDALILQVEKYAQLSGDISTSTQKTSHTLADIGDKYAGIVSAVKELSGAEKELTQESEKRNSVLEAQKKLEEAIAKAKADYIKSSFEDYINGLKAEEELTDKQQSIDEARLKVSEAELAVEEKKQAVKEAEYDLQKAQDELEYARNNRSERVFNASTGMWEYQANQKNVQSAQDKVRQATEKVADATKNVEKAVNDVEKAEQNVQKAVESLQKYLKDKAISEIKTAIENGSTSAADVDTILNKWFGDGGGTWGEGVKSAIATAVSQADGAISGNSNVASAQANVVSAKQALTDFYQNRFYTEVSDLFGTGNAVNEIEVQALINKYRALGVSEEAITAIKKAVSNYLAYNPFDPTVIHKPKDVLSDQLGIYDGGGILSGLGGIKATSQPELVIDPELTRRILNPANNDAFSKFASSLGIIFGSPLREGLLRSTYTNNWQNTSNSDNRSYVVNGVPITQQAARDYTIAELFENMALV